MKEKLLKYLYPIVLFLLPFMNVYRGIEYSDTTCAISNYVHLDQLSSFWKYGYYFSLQTGRFLMHLPFGDTMLGLRLYTTLFISALALIAFFFCRRLMSSFSAFLGIVLAICMSWCTSYILYNYLTYLLFLLAVICLYHGLTTQKNRFLMLAGILLALNVFVRFPNFMEAALILAVIYYIIITKTSFRESMKKIGICIAGYLAGLVLGLIPILLFGSANAYIEMIRSVLFMSGSKEGYSLLDMIYAMFRDYLDVRFFDFVLVGVLIAGTLYFLFASKIEKKNQKSGQILIVTGKILCPICAVLLFYWFYRRGLMGFDYSSYFSFAKLGAIYLTITMISALYIILRKKGSEKDRLFAFLTLLIVLITPFGSNNGIYPILNNQFLTAPFTMMILHDLVLEKGYFFKLAKENHTYTAKVLTITLVAVTMVQSAAFYGTFAFHDGNKLDTRMEGTSRLNGMVTTKENAAELGMLIQYMEENTDSTTSILTYGNLPGLYYILDRDPATTDLWPDLPTNELNTLREDIQQMEESNLRPIIILGFNYSEEDEKYLEIQRFMNENEYQLQFETIQFHVYF